MTPPFFGTFVINLDKDTERMKFMETQLRTLRISYERLRALQGIEVALDDYVHKDTLRKGGHALLLGELGCAASHKSVYELMLARGMSYALVLEDDVELPGDFKTIVEREITHNAGRWEYLLFDYWNPGTVFLSLWVRSVQINIRNAATRGFLAIFLTLLTTIIKGLYIIPLSFFEGWRNEYKKARPGPVTFYRPLYLAGAYLVSASGAKKLLELSSPIIYAADKLPNQARIKKGLKFRAYAPVCVRQLKQTFGSSMLGLSGDEIWDGYVPGVFQTSRYDA